MVWKNVRVGNKAEVKAWNEMKSKSLEDEDRDCGHEGDI